MLQGESLADTADLANYLHFASDGSGGTTISIDANGLDASNPSDVFEASQQITLSGVDLTGGGMTDQQILNGLLADGNLIVD